jgi:putative MATE family efflux protein
MFSEKWNYKEFWKYVLPSVLSMLFISLYTIVDGLFVARYVGTKALAAVNITHPIYNLGFGVAIMLSVGGSALISIALGEGNKERANNDFSLITLVIILATILVTIIGLMNLDQVLRLLGVSPELYRDATIYARILFFAIPFLGVKVSYEYFLRVDDCANLSLIVTVIGGVINMILDYFFVAKLGLGIAGAGYATVIGIIVPSFVGAAHFFRNPKHIRYIKPSMDLKFLKEASINGSSEMVTELSGAITAVLFNVTLIKYAGANGVAANSVLMYILFIFIAISIGLTMGVQPAISYSYGAKNYEMIKDIMKKSITIIVSLSLVLFVFIQLFGNYPISLFLKNDLETAVMASSGLKIFSIALLIAGLNILGSGYFTAINNGKISALISFSRSIVLLVPSILLLPNIFNISGIWMAIPVAELGTILVTLFFFKRDDVMRSHIDSIKVSSV